MKSKPSLMHAWWVSQCTFGISSKSWTAHSSIAYDHLLDTYLIIVISFGGPSKDRSYALSRVSLWFMLSTARRYLCVVWPPMFYPWVCHAFSQKLFHGTQDILLSPFCLLAFSYPGTPISHSYLTRSRHTLLTQHTHTPLEERRSPRASHISRLLPLLLVSFPSHGPDGHTYMRPLWLNLNLRKPELSTIGIWQLFLFFTYYKGYYF